MDTGRQPYVVKYGGEFYFHQTISNFRKEDVVFPKLSAKDMDKIKRNPNVFKNWVSDTADIIEKCTKADFEYWKMTNFVKDPGDRSDIKEIIKENYIVLKDMFTHIACRSNWPCIGSLDFSIFCESSKIPDAKTTTGIIDT